ncbi:hypothetical protein FZEAL_4985 [Fusarium zealandicum]|uniref:Uncharacterized protein n=1 Tax=Fusarium zealandicum TaxID=1053134 RepID=A0A8H4UKP2_9HYPO|nr:hypothetical protein FZEAL_4985 [Fusarium zealandicum]
MPIEVRKRRNPSSRRVRDPHQDILHAQLSRSIDKQVSQSRRARDLRAQRRPSSRTTRTLSIDPALSAEPSQGQPSAAKTPREPGLPLQPFQWDPGYFAPTAGAIGAMESFTDLGQEQVPNASPPMPPSSKVQQNSSLAQSAIFPNTLASSTVFDTSTLFTNTVPDSGWNSQSMIQHSPSYYSWEANTTTTPPRLYGMASAHALHGMEYVQPTPHPQFPPPVHTQPSFVQPTIQAKGSGQDWKDVVFEINFETAHSSITRQAAEGLGFILGDYWRVPPGSYGDGVFTPDYWVPISIRSHQGVLRFSDINIGIAVFPEDTTCAAPKITIGRNVLSQMISKACLSDGFDISQ